MLSAIFDHFLCDCCNKENQAESTYLWIPEHSMHSRIPRLMEAQQGALCPQSQHSSLPGRLCTLWSRLSPPPRAPLSALSPRSLSSLAESMLLVEGEAVRSRRCEDRQPRQRQHRRVTADSVRVRVSPHLDVIVVGDVLVSRGDARLDRLYPRLSQLLRLSLQHAAPADTPTMSIYIDVHLQAAREAVWLHDEGI